MKLFLQSSAFIYPIRIGLLGSVLLLSAAYATGEASAVAAVPPDQARSAETVDSVAEALAQSEAARLRHLLDAATQHRFAAREASRKRDYDKAMEEVEAAAALPLNPLTQSALAEAASLRDEILVQQAYAALNTGDLITARRALMAYRKNHSYDETGALIARELAAAEKREQMKSVSLSAPKVSTSVSDSHIEHELRRARSQYVAGEPQSALQTYQGVLAIDPKNSEALGFSTRIRKELDSRMRDHRLATRRQMLAEVDRSWQRPRVIADQEPDKIESKGESAMLTKLEAIILPSVSFTNTAIGQVVTALGTASQAFDNTGGKKRGVNIVLLDPAGTQPDITITLRNLSLKRVLDFVTQAAGYQYEVQPDAVVVRPGGESTTLDTEFFPVSRATVLRMTGYGAGLTPDPTVTSDPFSSSGASNLPAVSNGEEGPAMQAFLQQAGVNFREVEGSSLAYDGSSIIVTQTARNLERIRNILNRYNDIRQVEIEAKFIEVQEGTLDELGVSWNVATKATQRNAGAQALYQTSNRSVADAFSATRSNQQGSIISPALPTTYNDSNGNGQLDPAEAIIQQGRAAINLPIINNAPTIPGSPYLGAAANALANVTGVIGEFNVNAVVRALSQRQGTDLLSAPKVTVLSGNTATITVAQELRYPQSFGQTQSQVGTGSASGGGSAGVAITAGTPQEFTSRNVGVELKVTPTVEEDDYSISLDLNPRVTEFDGFIEYGGPSVAISGVTTVTVPSGFYQPIFSVRDISTKVTIWDGATLIMGGLTREQVKKVNDKVPILGDIPFLGQLFRSQGESAQKRNLLIFVTANLLSPGGSPKKQALRHIAPNSLFQNPVLVTPGGAAKRGRADK